MTTVQTGYAVLRRRGAPPKRHVFAEPVLEMLSAGSALCGARLSNWDRREMTGEEFLGDEIACPRCRRELRRPVELVEATDLAPGDQLRSAGRLLIVDRVIERAPLLDTSPWRWAVHLVGEGGRPVVLVGRQKVERVLPRS